MKGDGEEEIFKFCHCLQILFNKIEGLSVNIYNGYPSQQKQCSRLSEHTHQSKANGQCSEIHKNKKL